MYMLKICRHFYNYTNLKHNLECHLIYYFFNLEMEGPRALVGKNQPTTLSQKGNTYYFL